MKNMQQQLDNLLHKYDIHAQVCLENEGSAIVDGIRVPLLSHRSERRFIELRNIVQGGTLSGVSVMRTARIIQRGSDLYKTLYRELDICEFVLGESICSIMVMNNDAALNAIARTNNGIVCTIEISATLSAGEPPKDKHEIISQQGIACDVVVDAQLRQDSIYVFGDENTQFTDVDFELYGLTAEDAAVIRYVFAVAKQQSARQMCDQHQRLSVLVDMAIKSAASGYREEL